MPKKISWPRYWTSAAFSWPALFSPASLNTAESQSGWRQAWSEAWGGCRTGSWAGAWSDPHGNNAGVAHNEPDGALDLRGLSASSVIALVGLAFEARIAAGPGVLVICRGGESHAAEILPSAVRGGCRSIISFGVAGGLAPDLDPGDCIVASAVVDYPTLRPTDPLWSSKLLAMLPDARRRPDRRRQCRGVRSSRQAPACRAHRRNSSRYGIAFGRPVCGVARTVFRFSSCRCRSGRLHRAARGLAGDGAQRRRRRLGDAVGNSGAAVAACGVDAHCRRRLCCARRPGAVAPCARAGFPVWVANANKNPDWRPPTKRARIAPRPLHSFRCDGLA